MAGQTPEWRSYLAFGSFWKHADGMEIGVVRRSGVAWVRGIGGLSGRGWAWILGNDKSHSEDFE